MLQQQRTEHAEARAGARLLSDELSVQHLVLDALIKEGDTRTKRDLPPIWAWPEYRAVMARQLDHEPWVAVVQAYGWLGMFGTKEGLDPQRLDNFVQNAHLQLQRTNFWE